MKGGDYPGLPAIEDAHPMVESLSQLGQVGSCERGGRFKLALQASEAALGHILCPYGLAYRWVLWIIQV